MSTLPPPTGHLTDEEFLRADLGNRLSAALDRYFDNENDDRSAGQAALDELMDTPGTRTLVATLLALDTPRRCRSVATHPRPPLQTHGPRWPLTDSEGAWYGDPRLTDPNPGSEHRRRP